MEEVIAGLEGFTFAFEQDVELQKGTGLLPFQGMDKSSSAVCNFFAKGLCRKGMLCPLRHETGEKMVVCKHWLRGLCRKGDGCNFLHQYDVNKMPVCYFHSKFGSCSNKDCSFLHVKPAPKTQSCPWYDQGFCKDGENSVGGDGMHWGMRCSTWGPTRCLSFGSPACLCFLALYYPQETPHF
uniref:Cleavage and polyadenylation specificity factor subunit 4 n=1 Tax=Peromyscus maniculatus bairdii TaxID=230844 RepID=A0A8C8TG96_PERMB